MRGRNIAIETEISAVISSGEIQLIEDEDSEGYREGETPYLHLIGAAEVTRALYDSPVWGTSYRITCAGGETIETDSDAHSMPPWSTHDAIVDERNNVRLPCIMPNYPLEITVNFITYTGLHYYMTTVDTKLHTVRLMGMPGPSKATVTGRILGGEGKGILGVKVSVNSNITRSNAEGRFYLTGLDPISYTIKLEKKGYATKEMAVSLVIGDNPIGDIYMEGREGVSMWVFIGAGAGIGALGGFLSSNRAIGIPLGVAGGAGIGYAGYKIYGALR